LGALVAADDASHVLSKGLPLQAQGPAEIVAHLLRLVREVVDRQGAFDEIAVGLDVVRFDQSQERSILRTGDGGFKGNGLISGVCGFGAERPPAQGVETELLLLVDEDQASVGHRQHFASVARLGGREEDQRLRVFVVAILESAERGGADGRPFGVEFELEFERGLRVRRTDGGALAGTADGAEDLGRRGLKLWLRRGRQRRQSSAGNVDLRGLLEQQQAGPCHRRIDRVGRCGRAEGP